MQRATEAVTSTSATIGTPTTSATSRRPSDRSGSITSTTPAVVGGASTARRSEM